MIIVIVGIGGIFSVDVIILFVDGVYIVIVSVIDGDGNMIIVIDNGGVVDIIVFMFILENFGSMGDIILIFLGIIDFFEGSMVMFVVIDSVGNM